MKTDAIYARYSSHAQDDGTSIDVQLEQCERAAGRKCEHYIDRAKTGRAMGGRLELLRLLADAEAGRIGRVFVYKHDRLGRDAETHVIARQLEESGAELISATEGTNQLARGIQLVVAEDYSRQLAQRTRDGLIKRFEQGAFTGGVAPYGYRVTDRDGRRVLEIDPTEAEIVRDVVHQYLCESVGFKTIAKRLRSRGITSRRQHDKGKQHSYGWTFTSVRALLMNPILVGRTRYNARRMHLDRKSGRRVPRFKAQADHIERQDDALRIIDDATFDQIQARMTRRPGYVQAARGVAAFTGLMYCQCGSRLTKKVSARKGHTYNYWVCSRGLRYDGCPTAAKAREDKIMDLIRETFAKLFDDKEQTIAQALDIAREAVKSNRDDADRIKAELAQLDTDQERRGELLMDRSLPDGAKSAIGRQMAEAEQRRGMLLASIDGLRQQATDDLEGLAASVEAVFDDAKAALEAAVAPEAVNRFIERFIGPLEIQADGTILKKQMPPVEAEGIVQGSIAGARYVPEPATDSMRVGFWIRFSAVA